MGSQMGPIFLPIRNKLYRHHLRNSPRMTAAERPAGKGSIQKPTSGKERKAEGKGAKREARSDGQETERPSEATARRGGGFAASWLKQILTFS